MAVPETPSLRSTDVDGRRFARSRKGYDPGDVDAFLRDVAGQLARLEAQIERQSARADLLERRTASAQEAAYARIFRHLVDVMRAAEEAAGRIRAAAQDQAHTTVAVATEEAARVLAAAVAEADRILLGARADVARTKAERLVQAATR
jgi:DivIVA domain-containing protein